MCRVLYLICLLCALSATVRAQDINRDLLTETNTIVQKLGLMRDSSLKGIVGAITGHCNNEVCVMYAIYMWTAHFIDRDCAGDRHATKENNSASYVLRKREATTVGFANLIAEMCRLGNIACEVATGVTKWDADDIGHVDNETNTAAWNVVIVGKKRYVLDASLGAGLCDGKHFTRQLTDAWCLGNRRLFALSHLPRDKNMQVLDTVVERQEFVSAPIIGAIAAVIPVIPTAGMKGMLRGRHGDTLQLAFNLLPGISEGRIGTVAVATEGGKPVMVPFAKDNGMLRVGVPLPQEGKYPLALLINNSPAFTFQVQASEAMKRKPR